MTHTFDYDTHIYFLSFHFIFYNAQIFNFIFRPISGVFTMQKSNFG